MHATGRQEEVQAAPALAVLTALVVLAGLVTAGPAVAVPDCTPRAEQRQVAGGLGVLEAVMADRRGRLFLSDMGGGRLLRIDRPGAEPHVLARFQGPAGLAWDADGTLIAGYGNSLAQAFADAPTAGLNRVDPDTGAVTEIASGMGLTNGVVRGPDGSIYATNTYGREGGRIDRVRDGRVEEAWSSVDAMNGLVLDRSGESLYGASSLGPRVMRIPIASPERFEVYSAAPDEDGLNGFDGMTRDDAGRLYVTAQPAGEVWRVDGPGRWCAVARGLTSPSAVGFGGGAPGFPADSLFVVTFAGQLIEIPGATPTPPVPGPPLRLRLAVSPRSATAGRVTRFRFTVTAVDRSRAVPVEGAVVRFAGRRVRTGAGGRAEVVRRVARARTLPANTTARGYETGRTRVRVRAAR